MEKLNRKIPIKNVLYMFSYIWDKVEYLDFTKLDSKDDFDSANIFCELFLDNVNSVLKRGLYKEYNEKEEDIRGIKGRINFKQSINQLSFNNAKAVCIYDNLEENNKINQIIKSTAYKLYKASDLLEENKRKLNNVLLYFNNIDIIEINNNSFNINFNRNNMYVYYLILICQLINQSMMLSEDIGKYKFIDIFDDDNTMNKVFEMFVYKFYLRNLKDSSVSYQKKLNWNIKGKNQDLIPEMRLDILIENKDEIIILDTKYYESMFSNSYMSNKKTLISGNMYQMYTYLNQYDTIKPIKGILLYPYNGNNINENYEVDIIKNNSVQKSILSVKTINLEDDWKIIEENLMLIIKTT